jgi:hypothetical protein
MAVCWCRVLANNSAQVQFRRVPCDSVATHSRKDRPPQGFGIVVSIARLHIGFGFSDAFAEADDVIVRTS